MSDNCVSCGHGKRTGPDLLCDFCRAQKQTTDKAKRAIQHVLTQIRDHPTIGWYMGYGTTSFETLTEAAAALWNEPVEKVRKMFMPQTAKDPNPEPES